MRYFAVIAIILLSACSNNKQTEDPITYLKNLSEIDLPNYMKTQIELSIPLSCSSSDYAWDGKMGTRKCNDQLDLYGYPVMVRDDLVGIQYIHHHKNENRKIYKFTTYDFNESEWTEKFNDLGKLIHYGDLDGDQIPDIVLDGRTEYPGSMVGTYNLHSSKHGLLSFNRYSIDSVATNLEMKDYSFTKDSVLITTIKSIKNGQSYSQESKKTEKHLTLSYLNEIKVMSDQLNSDRLDLDSFKKWLESGISDFTTNTIIPLPHWFKGYGKDNYVPIDYHFSTKGNYGILLLRDNRDLGEPIYNYRAHVIENKNHITDYLAGHVISGEDLECELPQLKVIKTGDAIFEITNPACDDIPELKAKLYFKSHRRCFGYRYDQKDVDNLEKDITILEKIYLNLPEAGVSNDRNYEALIYERNPIVKELAPINTNYNIIENSIEDLYFKYDYTPDFEANYTLNVEIKLWNIGKDEYLVGRTINSCEFICSNNHLEFYKTSDGKTFNPVNLTDISLDISNELFIKENSKCSSIGYLVNFEKAKNDILVVVESECDEEDFKTISLKYQFENNQFILVAE